MRRPGAAGQIAYIQYETLVALEYPFARASEARQMKDSLPHVLRG